MEIPGYEVVDELLRSGPYLVYRGRRSLDAQPVLLETTSRVPAHPPAIEGLEGEFELLREAPIDGVPAALDLVRFAGTACLVLEDRGLTTLGARMRAGRPDLKTFFGVALRLCGILADLHRRNLVHGSVNPATALVAGGYDDVQLLCVGLGARPSGESWVTGPPVADGAAAYISPEQTGRINRAIDYRTDFYSLGATLYELLTGRPPFRSDDFLELVHSHIAKTPVPPSAIDAGLPEAVSRIVMRMLAKAAEDRYQSARGIAHDLEQCAGLWAAGRPIAPFDLGERDVSDRFLIPRKLYGRDHQVARLQEAFEATCEGATALLLVSGYSGIGKSSLISELYRPIVRQRGYFTTGKFDQVVRNVPYGAAIQAFRGLVFQLLTEGEDQLARWRERLGGALGPNRGVLAEVIPEIEFIVGKQAPPPPLDPAEAKNRFRYVFQSFVGALARQEHPLVVFLDDLQWVDAATLDLLHDLLTATDIRHLLLIGAYRDNEVDPGHPLSVAVARLEAANARVNHMSLGPLGLQDLVALMRETLHQGADAVTPLAELLLEKTAGNPFFVIQFLKALHREGLFEFDHKSARWSFRVGAIAAAGMTDNVIDLMTRRIRALSPRAQAVLTLAACLGNPFEWSTFLTVSRQPPDDGTAGLAEALEAGLIQPAAAAYEGSEAAPAAGVAYAFLHDRVQQAAYAQIPEQERAAVHLGVGRQLLAESGPDGPGERLFEIVNHLNVGSRMIDEAGERLALARLNLAAGRKAKASAAYRAALDHLQAGVALCAEEHWRTDYPLVFALHLEEAECLYLAGAFDAAERAHGRLLSRAATVADEASVHELRVTFYENRSRYPEAIASGRDGLALYGLSLPDGEAAIDRALGDELAAIQRLLANRPIAALAEMPVMDDVGIRTAMRILTLMWAPVYISGNQRLTSLISATMVRLSLAYGNTEDSAYGYVTHAITAGPVRHDFRAAYEWGELALAVNERFGDTKRRAKIHQQIHAHVKLWRRPFEACIPHAREARRSGLEAGDFAYAGYGAATESWPALLASRDLARFVGGQRPLLAFLAKINMPGFRDALHVLVNWALALQGRTAGRLSLSTDDFDEADFVARYATTAPLLMTVLRWARLHLCVIFEEVEPGLEAVERAREVTIPGTIWPVLQDFWGALALAAGYAGASDADRRRYRSRIASAEASLEELAGHCPENFRCFWLLVAAERSRVDGDAGEAMRFYKEAMGYAWLTDNLQQQALANDLCARWLVAKGDLRAASEFLAHAYHGYAEWGALARLRQMEERYGRLLAGAMAERADGSDRRVEAVEPSPSLDIGSVLKVARAIAGEIEVDGLLRKLMTIAIENAGAERGVFLEMRDGTLLVEAEAAAADALMRVRQSTPLDDADRLARSVARYVSRTGQDLVIGNAADDERFASDPYVRRSDAKSILCVPVKHQGRLRGLLYLENNLTTEAFTPERAEMMRILAAQAAISLENARLYEGMKLEVDRRAQAEQALREALGELEVLKNRLEAENVYLQEEIRTQHNFNEIVGNSPALLESLHRVERVAPTESTVLILGETGSGKELFARAVHSRSRRADRPLVKVNCGAIAPGLVESELFGHVKGAFTGAIDKRVGRFEVADGGTIFLDEIGELPLDAQVKLLRVLQEQEFEPVGSSRTVRVDVRVIAATNRNLEQAVREGTFRLDLLYRLNVFPVEVPPLRQRPSDIGLLVGFLVAGLGRKLGKPIQGFSARSMDLMMAYPWPGNVRELQNVVERAAILAQGPVLEVDRAFVDVASTTARSSPAVHDAATLEDVERAHIVNVLKQTGGVVEGLRGAATILGLHPNTLRSRMKKLGIPTASRRG